MIIPVCISEFLIVVVDFGFFGGFFGGGGG